MTEILFEILYRVLDYITNLQQKLQLANDTLDTHNELIEKLQQDLDKANDIIEKDRQFYKCRMDEYAELKKENKKLNRMCELYSKSLYNAELTDYKSRCEGTINLIDRTIEIIKQQPTKDDSWILSRLYGFKYALNGSDEK